MKTQPSMKVKSVPIILELSGLFKSIARITTNITYYQNLFNFHK